MVDTERIQRQTIEAKKSERSNELKEVKRMCKQFGFSACIFKGKQTQGR